MRILVFPFGSAGDVHPFLGLAVALRQRGHAVTFFVNEYFADVAREAGLDTVVQGSRDDFHAVTGHPDLWHPTRSFGVLFREGIVRVMRRQIDAIREQAAAGPVLVIANLLDFGARLARDGLHVPLVTVHCQPACLWSEHDTPALPGIWRSGPRWIRRWQYKLGERLLIDPAACPETNRLARELGLPPMRRTTQWWHSPDGVVCLFPEWFAAPQPDWPTGTVCCQFPLWDEATVRPPQPELDDFLAAGEPPLLFTPGSPNRQAGPFFLAAVDACRRLGRRGLLLTRYPEQLPPLPDSVRHFDYVPFSRVFPRVAAVVHHGGIGSTAQGLRAGVPQLLMPMSYDQPDNAHRVRRLGVGDAVVPARFRGPRVAAVLDRLLSSTAVKRACREVADRFHGVDPFAEACAALEAIASR